jgi:hypothetical protein
VKDITRKEALTALVVLPALAGAMTGAAFAADDSGGTKKQFKYQEKPNGKQECSGCALFTPGKTAKADGTCKIVHGAISPEGWCSAFSPKG